MRTALLVSGLRWRARSSLAMLAVAIFASGAAAFGPLYLHSTDRLVLRASLASAPPASTGLTFAASPHRVPAVSPGSLARSAASQSGGRRGWWGSPISSETATFLTVASPPGSASSESEASRRLAAALPYGPTRPFAGTLVSRTGLCAHLTIVAGTCPRSDGVAVSTRTAQLLGLGVGGTLQVRFPRTAHEVELSIAAIYRPQPRVAPYWWGHNYDTFGAFEPGLTALVELDGVFTSGPGVRAEAPARDVSTVVQLPYRQRSLSVDQVGMFEGSLASVQSRALRDRVTVRTGLWQLLAHAGSVEHAASTVVGVADLELVLLGVLLLYFVASRTAGEREPDVRLASLRGFRSRRALAVALAEPVAIVSAAVPLGLLGAWLLAGATATAIFGAGIGVSVTLLAVLAALAAGVAGVVAAALGARRSLASGPGSAAEGVAAPTRGSRWPVLVDVAVVVLAGVAFFELVVVGDSGGAAARSDPLAALAPGLLAAALGVIAARIVPRVLAATHLRTAFSGRLAAAFATRTVARRREFAAQIVLAALAVALATFAVSGWVIAGRNRALRAELGLGAPTVLTVSVRPGVTFLGAVRASDPSGRYAMAAVVEHARDGTTLALDASRLPAIASWPGDLGLPAGNAANRLLTTRAAPQVLLDGSDVSADIGVVGSARPAPRLVMNVFDVGAQYLARLTLGPLEPGVRRYTGRLPAGCSGGCRLVDLSVTWAPATTKAILATQPPSLTFRLLSLAEQSGQGAWAPVQAGIHDPRDWTSPSGGARLFGAGGVLGARLGLNWYGVPITLAPADVPKALPVLVTPTSASTASGDGGPLVVGLDGQTLAGHSVGEVPALPGVGPDAVLANLQTAERYLSKSFRAVTAEVWLAKTAPPAVVDRLRSHGVDVIGTHTAAATVAGLARSGLNLAYLLYLVSAIAAGLVAVSTTAFALSSGARRRRTELAAMRAVGIGEGPLRRALRAEQALVLTTGTVVGVVAGAVAAVVALRSVPEFVTRSPGPPLELGLPIADLLVMIGALVATLSLVIVVGSSVLVRGATVDKLAGGQ
jgi:putative ABC transport system permease protein